MEYLPLIKNNKLEDLKKNIEKYAYNYLRGELDQIVDEDKDFYYFELNVDDIDLSTNSDSKSQVDNIKKFYNAFQNLSESQAVEERLWVGLAHTKFFNFIQKRWPLKEPNENNVEKLINQIKRYYFPNNLRDFHWQHPLASLWWTGKKYYSDSYENRFAILDFLRNDFNSKSFPFVGSNFTYNKKLMESIYEVLYEFELSNNREINHRKSKGQKETELGLFVKYINLEAGASVFEIYNKKDLKTRLRKILNDAVRQSSKINSEESI